MIRPSYAFQSDSPCPPAQPASSGAFVDLPGDRGSSNRFPPVGIAASGWSRGRLASIGVSRSTGRYSPSFTASGTTAVALVVVSDPSITFTDDRGLDTVGNPTNTMVSRNRTGEEVPVVTPPITPLKVIRKQTTRLKIPP